MVVEEKLRECLDTLREIERSGYWPFASPAPCSTEVQIKKNIERAIENIDSALYWHHEMFGRGRDPMSPPRFRIVQIK